MVGLDRFSELRLVRDALVKILETEVAQSPRDLSLSGFPKYWRDEAKPYFGYDQWVGWMAIQDIMWMLFLDSIGFATGVRAFINLDWARETLLSMTSREMDALERKPEVGHDVNAMLMMERRRLPEPLKRYPHFALTSYDKISTARALMFNRAHWGLIRPAAESVDQAMRGKIREFADKVQIHRTHLQYALPGTVGFWLAVNHNHFVKWVRRCDTAAGELTGTVTGAIGVSSAIEAFNLTKLFRDSYPDVRESMESFFLTKVMGLGAPTLSTQIPDARQWAEYLSKVYFTSSVLGQVGEDMRILQASGIAEIRSVSSTSSTMAHKDSNPVGAEGMVGMYRLIKSELGKPLDNLISDLSRDLCNSRPERDYQTAVIYLFEQLRTAERVIKQMQCVDANLHANFEVTKFYVMGELLYLSLSLAGLPDAHGFVNSHAVPLAKQRGCSLVDAVDEIIKRGNLVYAAQLAVAWEMVDPFHKKLMVHPERYLGHAVEICMAEAENAL